MTQFDDAWTRIAKRQLKQMKTARRKRLLKRIVLHFKAVLPGCIGLIIGTIIGDGILNGFDRTLLRIYMVCGGYIGGYIIFKVNA